MDTELKRKWIEALRSGKYKQGKAELRHDDKFCCLGVLCDLIAPDAWHKRDAGYVFRPDPEYFGWGMYLPPYIRELSGVSSKQDSELATMNDGNSASGVLPRTFPEIADYIEANL